MRLRHHATLVRPDADATLLVASVGPGGDAIALWSTPSGNTAWAATRQHQTIFQRTDIDHLPEGSNPRVQPMPDGAILIVNTWCEWRKSGPDRNAIIFDRDGDVVTQGVLGDGIRDILTTTNGDIWVGYSDQGIFGNNGWGVPGPKTIGRRGLLRFDSDLRLVWEYRADNPDHEIADCEALNVSDDVVFAYIYMEYFIAEVRNGATNYWPTDLSGASALLVGEDRVALLGVEYHDFVTLFKGSLSTGEIAANQQDSLRFPHSIPAGSLHATAARGGDLHIFRGIEWYRASLDEL